MPVAHEYPRAYSPDIAYNQYGPMIKEQLSRFNRLDLLGHPTPLEKLDRLSTWLGRDIYIKRDDLTPLAMGGNKLRKLEYLAADAIAQGADTLITAGAIQSNHVRQTAALAAKLGLGCVALLENPIDTEDSNYLGNGNRLLLELFDAKVELVDNLDNADEQLQALAGRLRSNGKNPTWCRLEVRTPWARWVMCAPAWNWPSRSRTPGLNSPPWYWPRAVPAPTAAWRWR